MTPDDATMVSGDPVAVILARMEVKLDNALTEQARHSSQIDKIDERVDELERFKDVIQAGDLSARLARVEGKVLLAAGFAAAIGAGGGVGLTKLIGG